VFYLYIEEAMKETEIQEGVGFAENIEFCVEKEEDLQNIIIAVDRKKNKYGMQFNKKYTKIIVCSKTKPIRLNININN